LHFPFHNRYYETSVNYLA